MRISDWSSDVCSSDLLQTLGQALDEFHRVGAAHRALQRCRIGAGHFAVGHVVGDTAVEQNPLLPYQRDLPTQVGQAVVAQPNGRASSRERGWLCVSV